MMSLELLERWRPWSNFSGVCLRGLKTQNFCHCSRSPVEELSLCTSWRHVGGGGIAPRLLNLGTRWLWAVSFTTWSLTVGEISLGSCWIGGWLDPRSGLGTLDRRNILHVPRIEPQYLGFLISSLITISAELSLLQVVVKVLEFNRCENTG